MVKEILLQNAKNLDFIKRDISKLNHVLTMITKLSVFQVNQLMCKYTFWMCPLILLRLYMYQNMPIFYGSEYFNSAVSPWNSTLAPTGTTS